MDDPTENNPNLARYFASKEYDGTAQDQYLEVIYEDTSQTNIMHALKIIGLTVYLAFL